jgi:hypothetical protein
MAAKYDVRLRRLAIDPESSPRPGVIYSTVRRGAEWLRRWLDGQTEVLLVGAEGKCYGKASIRGVYYVRLDDVTPRWLLTSVEGIVTHGELRMCLDEAYQGDICGSDFVSVVWFERV